VLLLGRMPEGSPTSGLRCSTPPRHLPGRQRHRRNQQLDGQAVLARREEIVKHHDESSQVAGPRASRYVVRGRARLAGQNTVEVRERVTEGSVRTMQVTPRGRLETGTTQPAVPIGMVCAPALPEFSRDATNLPHRPESDGSDRRRRCRCARAADMAFFNSTAWGRGDHSSASPTLLRRKMAFAGEYVQRRTSRAGVTMHLGVPSFELAPRSARRAKARFTAAR